MKKLLLFLTSSLLLFSCKKDFSEVSYRGDVELLTQRSTQGFIVKFKQGVRPENFKAKKAYKFRHMADSIYLLDNIPPGLLKQVEYYEPNITYNTITQPNDPLYSNMWGLRDIAWDKVWETSTGKDVYVAVIDEGVDPNHEDLKGQIWVNPYDPVDGIDNDGNGFIDDINGWDFFNGDNIVFKGSPQSPLVDNHGTHVAGTIAAKTNNGLGTSGIASGAKVIVAKFLQRSGDVFNGALAIDYITDLKLRHGLNIVASNNSWGCYGQGDACYSQFLADAIERAKNADILFIAAAGNMNNDNGGVNKVYPASYSIDNVISVAAHNTLLQKAFFSSYGGTTLVSAPGEFITSTVYPNSYESWAGTSMAAPHVTAAAALYKAKYPGANYRQIKSAIALSASPNPGFMRKLNVQNLLTGGLFDDTQPPTVPTNIRVTGLGANSVTLQWAASTDNSGIVYYTVEHEGSNNFSTTTDTSTSILRLKPETNHTFSLYAFDIVNNKSQSVKISATTSPATYYLAFSAWVEGNEAVFSIDSRPTWIPEYLRIQLAQGSGRNATWVDYMNIQLNPSWITWSYTNRLRISLPKGRYNFRAQGKMQEFPLIQNSIERLVHIR
jgi:subtilisin family serine protease